MVVGIAGVIVIAALVVAIIPPAEERALIVTEAGAWKDSL